MSWINNKDLLSKFVYWLLVVVTLNAVLALVGQPAMYWRDYNLVNIGDPVTHFLLSHHPLMYIAALLAYLVVIYWLLRLVPVSLGYLIAVLLFEGHLFMVSSWLYTIYRKLELPLVPYIFSYLTAGFFLLITVSAGLWMLSYLQRPEKAFLAEHIRLILSGIILTVAIGLGSVGWRASDTINATRAEWLAKFQDALVVQLPPLQSYVTNEKKWCRLVYDRRILLRSDSPSGSIGKLAADILEFGGVIVSHPAKPKFYFDPDIQKRFGVLVEVEEVSLRAAFKLNQEEKFNQWLKGVVNVQPQYYLEDDRQVWEQVRNERMDKFNQCKAAVWTIQQAIDIETDRLNMLRTYNHPANQPSKALDDPLAQYLLKNLEQARQGAREARETIERAAQERFYVDIIIRSIPG